MKALILIIVCAAFAGCSTFSTTQIDERLNEQTGEKTKVTTKAAARTFFDSKSSLAKWTAKQSESTQSAEVGGLSQESSGTNFVNLIEAVSKGAAQGALKAFKP